MNEMYKKISLSVISHGQGELVKNLLSDLDKPIMANWLEEVILTCNVYESVDFELIHVPLRIIKNDTPKGFGANHNSAFKYAKGHFFCVVNPDVRLKDAPFPIMSECLEKNDAGIVVPFVYSEVQVLENSLRKFPTLRNLLAKSLGINSYQEPVPTNSRNNDFSVDWAAGMFMLFSRSSFQDVSGFDEDFFLYYEDVDICTRMWKLGKPVVVCSKAAVIHNAQRSSHKHLRYLSWHIASTFRYFVKHIFRLPKTYPINFVELDD